MYLREQLYVCTLAETGSVTRAAELLAISAPALSSYISSVEKTIGIPLFRRDQRSFRLTPLGEEYVRCARQMLELQDEFNRLAADVLNGTRLRIRIGIQMRRATYLVSPVLREFLRQYPDIDLVFVEGGHDELAEMYRKHKIDYFLCNFFDDLDGAEYIDIAAEAVLVELPEEHPANAFAEEVPGLRFPVLDLKYLDGGTLILPRPDQSLRKTADALLHKAGVRPKKIIEIQNFSTILSMVSAGIGIGFNREGYLKAMPDPGHVRFCYAGKEPLRSRLVLACPEETRSARQAPWFQTLTELLREYS